MLATLLPGLNGVVYVLDGSEEEVNSEVRRLAFASLARVIKHHSWKHSRDGEANAIDCIFRGLGDKERSVRLSAGNALGVLILTMSANGDPIEPIFERLYHQFDTAKIPGKETLIISVGLMGK